MEQPLVSVVLVTWNSAPYLRRCLEGIARQTHAPVELIAVDNGSSDDSAALVAPHAARVIRNDGNRGFAAAVNQGIAAARGELVQLVNPDCYLAPDYIATLVRALGESGPRFGAATGKLLRARGYDIAPAQGVDSAGMRMTRSGRHLDIDEDVQERREVFGVSGAAALFRMSFLQDVRIDGEVLDEDFHTYREDADLAWRSQLLGWRAVCEPAAVAWHVRRVTPEARRALPPDINMHSVKNRFLLRLKNEGAYLALRNAPFELARDFVVIAAALTIERTSLPAFAWLWRNRARVAAKRREIQRRRVVSDRALARWFR
ncbi:MAG TPA: glycosyltransferase family 2 protein [Thermoanaerobaculia bacterium]|jgi:GT2 family glycosyltransferase